MNLMESSENTRITSTIMKIKGCLMINDDKSKMRAVMWIKQQLNIASDKTQKFLIDKLIWSDVALVLCDILATSKGEIFMSILNIVNKLRHSKKFYNSNLAKRAIQSIFRMSYFMMKKPENYEDALSSVTHTVYMILKGAVEIDYSISNIVDHNDMILFLKELKSSNSSQYNLRQSAGKLLCLIAENIDSEYNYENQDNLFFAFEDSILSIGMIIDKHKCKKDSWLLVSLGLLCSICAVGTRFCYDDNDVQTTLTPKKFGGTAFTKMITKIIMKTVLPLFKDISFKREDLESNLENMVKCLDHLIQLKCCDVDEIATSLATNGYLKYLLTISMNSRTRDSACSVVSEVIAHLSIDSFSSGGTMENRIEFRNYIYLGIVTVERPFYLNNFEFLEKFEGTSSDVFIIVTYHHVRESADYSILQLPTIIKKLLNVMRQKPIIVQKSIWLLFAVSWIEHPKPQSVSSCAAAVEHLIILLENRELEKLYTHHKAIIEHCIVCEGFPIELQQEIIRLYLKFNGEPENVLQIAKYDLLADCFVKFVETGPENLVVRALKCIKELKREKLFQDRVDVVIWEALSSVVTSLGITGDIENVKGILKLSAEANLEMCPNIDEINGQSIVALVNMSIAQAVDGELKTLLLNYIRTLLEISLVRGNTKVLKTCLADSELARLLKETAFSKQDHQLAAASLNLLILIIKYQSKFNLECNIRAIVRLERSKMLVLLARTTYNVFYAAMKLLLVLLNQENSVIEPIVCFCHFEDETTVKQTIFSWYQQLHLLYSRARMEDWDVVFNCLTAVLRYCNEKNFPKLLRDLCNYSGTYGLIDWTIERKYSDAPFLEFVETWVPYCRETEVCNTSNIVDEWTENVLGPTEFEECLTKYIQFRRKYNK